MRPGETTANEFDAQMRVISSSFVSETFGSLIERRRSGNSNENTVVVTFDDGYRDNIEIALPILRKYGVKATFFLATGYLDGGMMWNDRLIEAMRASVGRTVDLCNAGMGQLHIGDLAVAQHSTKRVLSTIKRWPQAERSEFVDEIARSAGVDFSARTMMNGPEVVSLADAGMEIGGHTVTHPILRTLTADQSRNEITECKSMLEDLIRREVVSFAYPNGRPGQDFSEDDVVRVREAGYQGAATTEWGCALPVSDNFRIPRQSLWGSSRSRLWAQLVRNFLS